MSKSNGDICDNRSIINVLIYIWTSRIPILGVSVRGAFSLLSGLRVQGWKQRSGNDQDIICCKT
jgi:hypothetical protein